MWVSANFEVANWSPRLRGRIPWRDWGEVVIVLILTTSDKNYVVNHRSLESNPWLRKLATLHLPPHHLAAASVDANLVVRSAMEFNQCVGCFLFGINNTSKTDVTPWCCKWDEIGMGMGEVETVVINVCVIDVKLLFKLTSVLERSPS